MQVLTTICGPTNVMKICNILGMITGIIKKFCRWLGRVVKYFFCVILPYPLKLLYVWAVYPVWEVCCMVNGLAFNIKEIWTACVDRCYRRHNPYDALEAV